MGSPSLDVMGDTAALLLRTTGLVFLPSGFAPSGDSQAREQGMDALEADLAGGGLHAGRRAPGGAARAAHRDHGGFRPLHLRQLCGAPGSQPALRSIVPELPRERAARHPAVVRAADAGLVVPVAGTAVHPLRRAGHGACAVAVRPPGLRAVLRRKRLQRVSHLSPSLVSVRAVPQAHGARGRRARVCTGRQPADAAVLGDRRRSSSTSSRSSSVGWM
ncbi:hypothetical protein MYXA107069_25645 [Myxococcus xanthus]|nr:hypothetical protein MyxoNM_32025 [Myxococcus xanthus]SDY13769.1 hypothetical protein SAMN05444383_11991 [Myxococcus xanthus]